MSNLLGFNRFVTSRRSICFCILSFLSAVFLSRAEHPLPEGYTLGTPWVGPVGIREQTAEIMQREKLEAGTKKVYRQRLRLTIELTERLEIDESISTPPPTGPAPLIAQTAGLSFLGATLAETFSSFPPDTMGAAGPSQYIVCVNGRIRSFNKSTGVADGVLNANTDVFFQSVMTPPVTNNFTSDPRIRYDRLSQRWFVV